MSTIAPVNPRASVAAVFDEGSFDADHVPAGHFHFYTGSEGDVIAGMLFGCPCGCGELKSVGFRPHEKRRPSWEWNGDRARPTLNPSINILQLDMGGKKVGEHWHGWLRNGEFQSC